MAATLFIVTGDPSRTARTAEAVRIAAGISVWKRNTVALYFRGAAVMALSQYADESLDGDAFTRYFPVLRDATHPVYIQQSTPWLKAWGDPLLPFKAISDSQLATLVRQFQFIARF